MSHKIINIHSKNHDDWAKAFGSNRQTNRQRGRRNAERSTYNGHSGSVNFSTYIGAKLPVNFNKTYTGNIAKYQQPFSIGQGIGWLAIVLKNSQTITG